MKKYSQMTKAERIIYRISELRELGLRLAAAGRRAGLHSGPRSADFVYATPRKRVLLKARETRRNHVPVKSSGE